MPMASLVTASTMAKMYIIKKRLDFASCSIRHRIKSNRSTRHPLMSSINGILISMVSSSDAGLSTKRSPFFEEQSKLSQSGSKIGTAGKNDYLQSQVDLNVQRSNALSLDNEIRLVQDGFNRIIARDPFMLLRVQEMIITGCTAHHRSNEIAIDSLNPDIFYPV